MFYFVSDNRSFTCKIKCELLKRNLFFYSVFGKGNTAFRSFDDKKVDAVLIDATSDRVQAGALCRYIKEKHPNAKTISILKILPEDDALFRYVEESDYEICVQDLKEIAEFVNEYIIRTFLEPPHTFHFLVLGSTFKQALLLGFPLNLTRAEYRVACLLCQNPCEYLETETILNLCFPESYRMAKTNISTHIFNINRKAADISNRPLVINLKGTGYMLNPNM